jgi:hypothetical protein
MKLIKLLWLYVGMLVGCIYMVEVMMNKKDDNWLLGGAGVILIVICLSYLMFGKEEEIE